MIHCETWKNTPLNEVHGNKYICICKSGRTCYNINDLLMRLSPRSSRGVKLKCMLLNPDRKTNVSSRVYLSYSHASIQPEKKNKQTNCMSLAPIAGGSIYSIYIMITITTYTIPYPYLDLHDIFWNRHVPEIFHTPNTSKKPKRTMRDGF